MSQTAEHLQQMVQQALAEFERLASSDQPPTPVLQQMLSTLVRVLGCSGGAVWMTTDNTFRNFKPVVQAGQKAALITSAAEADNPVQQVVARAAAENKPIAVSPEQGEFAGSPLQALTQFYIPIDALGRVAGVIHLLAVPELDPKVYRQYVTFAQHGARAAAVYLAKRQSQVLKDDAASHGSIVKLMQKLLTLHRPADVAHELANHGRQLLEARRVAVVGYWRRKPHSEFSNTIEVNRRAVLVQAVEELAEHVRQREVPMSFARDQKLDGEDEALAPLLGQLWEKGEAGAVCMTPLRSGETIVGVMIAEYDDAADAGRRGTVQQELCQQAGPVLDQAVRWHTRPLRRTSNALDSIRRRPFAKLMRTVVTMALVAAIVYVLFFMPFYMNVTANARLEPAHLAAITAPHAGRVLKIHVDTGQNVAAGDVLISLDDTDLQLERAETLKAIDGTRVELEAARRAADLSKMRTTELRIEQLQLSLQTVERQIERCSIRALIDGVVLDETPEHWIGATVSEGHVLLTLGDLKGFELTIEVPEGDLMLVEQALRSDTAVPVDFLSHAWPDLTQHATITDLSSLSPTTRVSEYNQQAQVFRISVPVELEGLAPQLVLANPTGRAKLQLPDRSIAYRWGRGVWHFGRMTLFSLF